MFKDLVKGVVLKRIEKHLDSIEKLSDENSEIVGLATTSKSVIVQGSVSPMYQAREKEIARLSLRVVALSNIFKD